MTVPPLSLAAIRQPAFLYGPDGRIAEANDLADALAGRPLAGRTLAAVVGLFDVRSPDGTPLMAADLPAARALCGEEAVDVPLAITAADGRILHVLATASPIRDGGAVVGAFECWQNVTTLETDRAVSATRGEELQVQQEELRQQGDELARAVSDLDRQQRLLDRVLGALPHRISLWDRNERIIWANERFAAERGEPREALAGRSWRELGHPMGVVEPLVKEALEAVMAGATVAREVEVAGTAGREWRACTFLPFGRDAVLVVTEDVSERKRAGEALRESEDRYRSIVETAGEGVVLARPDGPYVYVNRRMEEILGRTADEILGRSSWDFTFDDWKDEVLRARAALPAGSPLQGEFRFRRPDGSAVWTLWNATPLLDEQGRHIGNLAMHTDITARKEAEEALRRRAEELEAVMDLAPAAIWVGHDPGCTRITGNRLANEFYEAEPGENVSAGAPSSPRVFCAPDGRELAAEELPMQLAAARNEPVRDAEFEVVLPSGRHRHLLGSAVPLREPDGSVRGAVAAFLDVTERRGIDLALAESEERLRLAQEGAAIGVWDWDVATGRIHHTPELLRLYGIEDDLAEYDLWRRYVHPDDLERIEAERDAALAAGEPFAVEFRVVRPSSEVRWLSGTGRGYYDDRGTLDPCHRDEPRHHRAEGGRGGTRAVRRGPRAVERGAAAVRVRGEPRPAGAAPRHRQLLPAPRAAVQGKARPGRGRVHRVHRRRREPDAAA